IWLPDSGSLQIVVLLTPGKWAPRTMCLRALGLMSCAPGVAAGGPRQAEPFSQRALVVVVAEHAAALEGGNDVVDHGVEVVADHAGSQPEAVEPDVVPGDELVGEL